jgi:hypothetical protein
MPSHEMKAYQHISEEHIKQIEEQTKHLKVHRFEDNLKPMKTKN